MKYKKLQLASTILLAVGCILLFIETFNVCKTYVGGLLIGVGFLLNALSHKQRAKDENYEAKNKPLIVGIMAVVLILAGILFIYLDLRH